MTTGRSWNATYLNDFNYYTFTNESECDVECVALRFSNYVSVRVMHAHFLPPRARVRTYVIEIYVILIYAFTIIVRGKKSSKGQRKPHIEMRSEGLLHNYDALLFVDKLSKLKGLTNCKIRVYWNDKLVKCEKFLLEEVNVVFGRFKIPDDDLTTWSLGKIDEVDLETSV